MFKKLLVFLIMITALSTEPGPCEKCQSWYDIEKNDLGWLVILNKEIQCPCRANLKWNGMKEIDNPSNKDWKRDKSCKTPKSNGCAKYHPGAAGCLRSKDLTDDGARQQCCYYKNGTLIRPGTKAAGTPDRRTGLQEHRKADVIPFKNCCIGCTVRGYCEYYVNIVRKGDNSHC